MFKVKMMLLYVLCFAVYISSGQSDEISPLNQWIEDSLKSPYKDSNEIPSIEIDYNRRRNDFKSFESNIPIIGYDDIPSVVMAYVQKSFEPEDNGFKNIILITEPQAGDENFIHWIPNIEDENRKKAETFLFDTFMPKKSTEPTTKRVEWIDIRGGLSSSYSNIVDLVSSIVQSQSSTVKTLPNNVKIENLNTAQPTIQLPPAFTPVTENSFDETDFETILKGDNSFGFLNNLNKDNKNTLENIGSAFSEIIAYNTEPSVSVENTRNKYEKFSAILADTNYEPASSKYDISSIVQNSRPLTIHKTFKVTNSPSNFNINTADKDNKHNHNLTAEMIDFHSIYESSSQKHGFGVYLNNGMQKNDTFYKEEDVTKANHPKFSFAKNKDYKNIPETDEKQIILPNDKLESVYDDSHDTIYLNDNQTNMLSVTSTGPFDPLVTYINSMKENVNFEHKQKETSGEFNLTVDKLNNDDDYETRKFNLEKNIPLNQNDDKISSQNDDKISTYSELLDDSIDMIKILTTKDDDLINTHPEFTTQIPSKHNDKKETSSTMNEMSYIPLLERVTSTIDTHEKTSFTDPYETEITTYNYTMKKENSDPYDFEFTTEKTGRFRDEILSVTPFYVESESNEEENNKENVKNWSTEVYNAMRGKIFHVIPENSVETKSTLDPITLQVITNISNEKTNNYEKSIFVTDKFTESDNLDLNEESLRNTTEVELISKTNVDIHNILDNDTNNVQTDNFKDKINSDEVLRGLMINSKKLKTSLETSTIRNNFKLKQKESNDVNIFEDVIINKYNTLLVENQTSNPESNLQESEQKISENTETTTKQFLYFSTNPPFVDYFSSSKLNLNGSSNDNITHVETEDPDIASSKSDDTELFTEYKTNLGKRSPKNVKVRKSRKFNFLNNFNTKEQNVLMNLDDLKTSYRRRSDIIPEEENY